MTPYGRRPRIRHNVPHGWTDRQITALFGQRKNKARGRRWSWE